MEYGPPYGYPLPPPRVALGAEFDGAQMWLTVKPNDRRQPYGYVGSTDRGNIVFVELCDEDPILPEGRRVFVRLGGQREGGGLFKCDRKGRPMYIGLPVRNHTETRDAWFREGDDRFVHRSVVVDWTDHVVAVGLEKLEERPLRAGVRVRMSLSGEVDWGEYSIFLRERYTVVDTVMVSRPSNVGEWFSDNIGKGPWVCVDGNPIRVGITDVELADGKWPFASLNPSDDVTKRIDLLVGCNFEGKHHVVEVNDHWCYLPRRTIEQLEAAYPPCGCYGHRRARNEPDCARAKDMVPAGPDALEQLRRKFSRQSPKEA